MTSLQIKALITSFPALDGESKMENPTGSSETPGENIGEKWVSFESRWVTTKSESNQLEPGPRPESGPSTTSPAEKTVPDAGSKGNTKTPPRLLSLLSYEQIYIFL